MHRSKFLVLGVTLSIAFTLSGCRQPAPPPPPAKPSPPSTPDATPRPSPRTPLEAELNYLAEENFVQVIAFTRLDGGVLNQDDFAFLKANANPQVNQWLKTDDGLNALAGTNFPFTPENLEALRKRFKVQDYSAEYGRKK